MRTSLVIKALLAVAAAGLPLLCNAESTTATGTGALSTTAHVDFQVTIPKFLSLQVGTAGTKIDQITFSPTSAQVGNSTPVAGVGGDQTGGVETAQVIANAGTVTFSSNTTSALSDGAGDTISYAQIAVATAARTSTTVLASPALVDGGTTTISLAAVNKVVSQDALWTYSYKNTVTPAAGTYGGVNANGSRVTYTASVL